MVQTLRYRVRKAFRGLLVLLSLLMAAGGFQVQVNAAEGTLGYNGGISVTNRMVKDTWQYREVTFVTGKPVVLDGTLTLKKSVRAGKETATYTYKLANAGQAATLTRVVILDSTLDTKNNGQLTRATLLSRIPTEVLKVGSVTYTLSTEEFTRSDLTDPRPAIDYHAGEFRSKKVYKVGTGADVPTVTVETSGRVSAYDQYWSNTQTQNLQVKVSWAKKGSPSWGGTAEVAVSGAMRQRFDYRENEPTAVSFDGGYIRTTWEEAVLEYSSSFPEFDKAGKATDRMVTASDRLALNTEPVTERLMVPDIRHIKGHWAEKPVHILYGLEIIPGTGEDFNAQKYLTRAEFTAQAVKVFKAVPPDPTLRTTVAAPAAKAPAALPFIDIALGDKYLDEILDASDRRIVVGRGMSYFRPDDYIIRAEVVTIAIKALGLNNLAPSPNAVTPFSDNDAIPTFGRNPAAVAAEIGIIEPGEDGRFRPLDHMTSAEAAQLFHRLINYMGDDLVTDYRQHITAW